MKELKCSYREKSRIFACIKYCFYHTVHKCVCSLMRTVKFHGNQVVSSLDSTKASFLFTSLRVRFTLKLPNLKPTVFSAHVK